VADEGGVYLVPGGRVSLDNPKIPRLFPAEPQSSRESIQGLLQGMPTTTFRLNTPQTHWTPAFAGVTRLGSIAPPSRCSHCPSARHSLAGGKPPGTGVVAASKAVIPAQAGIHGAPALSRGVDTSGTAALRPNSPQAHRSDLLAWCSASVQGSKRWGPLLTFEKANLAGDRASWPRGEITANCAFFPGNVICPMKECQTPHLLRDRLRVHFHPTG
jgi:hypothetical protein